MKGTLYSIVTTLYTTNVSTCADSETLVTLEKKKVEKEKVNVRQEEKEKQVVVGKCKV